MELLRNVELVMWNLPSGKEDMPSVSRVRVALSGANLNQDRATDIPASTAFRRACDSIRDKVTLVRPFSVAAKDGEEKELRCQVDREGVDGSGELCRSRVGVYRLAVYPGNNAACYSIEACHAASFGTQDTLRAAFEIARTTYTWSDCSKVIQDVMTKDGLGAYSPRKSGGVYFVPLKADSPDLLDRVERFASSLGVRFLRYSVPDTGAQRSEVAEAIAAGINADIDSHAEAIASYSAETRPGVIATRGERMEQTVDMLTKLANLLQAHANPLRERMAGLAALRDAAEALATQSRPAAGQGRRIVMTQPA